MYLQLHMYFCGIAWGKVLVSKGCLQSQIKVQTQYSKKTNRGGRGGGLRIWNFSGKVMAAKHASLYCRTSIG